MNVGKAVHHIFTNTSAVTAIVSTRIWRTQVDQKNTTYPIILITRISNPPISTKDGNTTFQSRIQVDYYAVDMKGADALAVLGKTALDRKKSGETVNGFKIVQIDIDSENDSVEPHAGLKGLFRVSQDYIITYNE